MLSTPLVFSSLALLRLSEWLTTLLFIIADCRDKEQGPGQIDDFVRRREGNLSSSVPAQHQNKNKNKNKNHQAHAWENKPSVRLREGGEWRGLNPYRHRGGNSAGVLLWIRSRLHCLLCTRCILCLFFDGASLFRTPAQACHCADFAALRRLHLQGHDVGGFDVVGDKTPIHIAAANGSMEIVRYLIDHADVDPEVLSGSGMTALSMAKQGGHYPVIMLLSGGDGGQGGAPHQDPLQTLDADQAQHGHASAAASEGPMDIPLGQGGGKGGRSLQRDVLRRGSWSRGDTVGGRGGDSIYTNVQWRGEGGGPWMNHVQEHGSVAGSSVKSSGWIQGGEHGGAVHHGARFAPLLGRPPPSKNEKGQQRAYVVDDDRDLKSDWQQGQGNQGGALMGRMPQHQFQQQYLQKGAGVRGGVDQRQLTGEDGSSKRHDEDLRTRGAVSGRRSGNDANADHNNDTDDNNFVKMPLPHSSGLGANQSSNNIKQAPARSSGFDQIRPVSSGMQTRRLSFSTVSRGDARGVQYQQQYATHLQRRGGQSLYGGAEAAAFKGPGNNSINNYYYNSNKKNGINNSGLSDTMPNSVGGSRGLGEGYGGGSRPVTAQAEPAAKPCHGGGFVVGLSNGGIPAHM